MFLIDLVVWEEINQDNYPYAFSIKLNLKHPNDDGLPGSEELKFINELENAFIESINPESHLHVGTVTLELFKSKILRSSKW
ncbi:DUF695 domain-containing protein [Niallia sp. 03133]|uniref:DUF695 domain-containing protein n=1 Tax=Niallia sp. 03133 TaxID=3458060 RepID=UPI004044FB44